MKIKIKIGSSTLRKGFFGIFLERNSQKNQSFLTWFAIFKAHAPASCQTAAGFLKTNYFPTCPVAESG
jgi:hypothetical protein